MPKIMSLFEYYEKSYEYMAKLERQNSDQKFWTTLIDNSKKLSILDLGCSQGKLAVELALLGHNVTAADIAQKCLNQTKQLAKKNSVKIDTIKCDVERLNKELHGKKFDVIYFLDVIEHLRNPVSSLVNIREILKKDGFLFIHTPNSTSLYNIIYLLFKRKELRNYFSRDKLGDLHFQTYDYLSLEKTLNFCGLKVIEIIPTTLLNSRLLSRLFPFFSDSLLLKIIQSDKIDIKRQIVYWEKNLKPMK